MWFALDGETMSTVDAVATVVATIAAADDMLGDDVVSGDSICAFNCQLVWGTLWYRGLFNVNGIYLYLIICWNEKGRKNVVIENIAIKYSKIKNKRNNFTKNN